MRAGEPAKARQSSSSGNAADSSGGCAEHGASTAPEEPSPAQMQMAERIADAVAARLSQKAMQSAAGSPRLAPSNEHKPLLPSSEFPEEAEQAMPAEPCEAAKKHSLPSTAEVAAPGHACEEDFLAALLQGSPGRRVQSGQRAGPQACEQDFLAALLLGSTRALLYLSSLTQV